MFLSMRRDESCSAPRERKEARRGDALLIACPPGPLPLMKVSSMSSSLIGARGGYLPLLDTCKAALVWKGDERGRRWEGSSRRTW